MLSSKFCVTHLLHSQNEPTKIENIYDSLMVVVITQSYQMDGIKIVKHTKHVK